MNNKKAFYASISKYYDYIFPFNSSQANFVKNLIQEENITSILDVGCGTGNLALELARENKPVFAIDSDEEMILTAIDKKRGMGLDQYPQFRELDMESLSGFFDGEQFDLAICFGNTLPHLLSYENIENFFKVVSYVLKKNAHLTIQILNYDYILENQIEALPVIDNDYVRFERYYDYPENSEFIEFSTKLTVKGEDKIIENSISLFPIQKLDLKFMLEDSGFGDVYFYGDFDKTPLKKGHLPLVVKCKKK
ncbi:MAG: methyltransferase domain-containing protein [Bacteroidales bacterium]